MRLHHPVYLEDRWGRFLLLNGEVEVTTGIYYYTGIWNNRPIIHVHKSGDSIGTTIVLDKDEKSFEFVHATIDLIIEGMGANIDKKLSVGVHKAYGKNMDYSVGYNGRLITPSVVLSAKYTNINKNRSNKITDEVINLPFNKTGLEVATELLRNFK